LYNIYLCRIVHLAFVSFYCSWHPFLPSNTVTNILKKPSETHQHFIMSCPRTVNTEIAFPNYCCLCCLQKHGSIKKKWGGSIVKKVSSQNKHYVYMSRGLTRHIRQSEECAAYYSSNGLSWLHDFKHKSSMLISGPTTHQQQHQPSSFGLLMTGNAPVVARHSQSSSTTYRSSSSNSRSQPIQNVVPNMLQAPVNRQAL